MLLNLYILFLFVNQKFLSESQNRYKNATWQIKYAVFIRSYDQHMQFSKHIFIKICFKAIN